MKAKLTTKDLPEFSPCVDLRTYPPVSDQLAFAERRFQDAEEYEHRLCVFCKSEGAERDEFEIFLLLDPLLAAIRRGREYIQEKNTWGIF